MQCLDAMKILRDRGVPVRLQLCGAGPLESEIPGRIAALGLQDCVELVGRVPAEQTRAKLAENDLLWLPSQHPEGQPYVLMEALEAGMPAMISRAGEGVGDMIDGAARRGGALIEAQPRGAGARPHPLSGAGRGSAARGRGHLLDGGRAAQVAAGLEHGATGGRRARQRLRAMRSAREGITSASGTPPGALGVRITRSWAGPGRRRGSAAAG